MLHWTMDQQTGWLINLFDLSQPITDVYRGQLTNEVLKFCNTQFMSLPLVNFHALDPIDINCEIIYINKMHFPSIS